MKKIISLLLALLMTFSVMTVAFATGEEGTDASTETTIPADEETTEDSEETTDFGDLQWILDLPFWTVKPALKFAKVAFKLVSAYLKVAKIFGLVEQDMDDMLLDAIAGLIEDSMKGEEAPEEGVTETTVPAVA